MSRMDQICRSIVMTSTGPFPVDVRQLRSVVGGLRAPQLDQDVARLASDHVDLRAGDLGPGDWLLHPAVALRGPRRGSRSTTRGSSASRSRRARTWRV